MEPRESDGPAPEGADAPGSENSAGEKGPPFEIRSDQSWKEEAQREKERLAREAARESGGEKPLPPASFARLLSDLGLQAMLALGLVRPEGETAPPVNLQAARYVIDTLGVLEDKTRGNLAAEEARHLAELLDTLRMRFVEVSRQKREEGRKIVTDETLIKDPRDLRGE